MQIILLKNLQILTNPILYFDINYHINFEISYYLHRQFTLIISEL
jgi:hypothetical protein